MTIKRCGVVQGFNPDVLRDEGKTLFVLVTASGERIECRGLLQFVTTPADGAQACVGGEWIAPGLLSITSYELEDS